MNILDEIEQELSEIKQLLRELKNERKEPVQDIKPLNVPEARDFLHYKSDQTIYQLVRENKIPNIKIGHKLYFLKEDLIAYLKKSRRNAVYNHES